MMVSASLQVLILHASADNLAALRMGCGCTMHGHMGLLGAAGLPALPCCEGLSCNAFRQDCFPERCGVVVQASWRPKAPDRRCSHGGGRRAEARRCVSAC